MCWAILLKGPLAINASADMSTASKLISTAAADMSTSHRGEQRIFLLDALRGFALFGILLGNIKAFSGLYLLSAEQLDLIAGGGHWNESIHFWSQVLIKAKFYSLFSLLFGIGVALQWKQAKPQGLRRRHSARMLVLMVIDTVLSRYAMSRPSDHAASAAPAAEGLTCSFWDQYPISMRVTQWMIRP